MILTITVQHVLILCLVCGYCFFDCTSVYQIVSNCTEQPSTRLASRHCRPSEANLGDGGETGKPANNSTHSVLNTPAKTG